MTLDVYRGRKTTAQQQQQQQPALHKRVNIHKWEASHVYIGNMKIPIFLSSLTHDSRFSFNLLPFLLNQTFLSKY